MENINSEVKLFGVKEQRRKIYAENRRNKIKPEYIFIDIIDNLNWLNYEEYDCVWQYDDNCLDEIKGIILRCHHDQNGLMSKEKWEIFKRLIDNAYDSPDVIEYICTYNDPIQREKRNEASGLLMEGSVKIERKKKRKIKGYIYILKFEKYYKIGKTININKRLEIISPEMPEKPKIIRSYKSGNIDKDEKYLHEIYKEKRTNGEWFLLSDDDLQEIDKYYYRKIKNAAKT